MTEQDPQLEALLEFLRSSRGFDFTGYKRATLVRRIRKRVSDLRLEGFAEYLDYLEVHQEEYTELFNTILINVTSFFRDQPAWDHLSHDVLPEVLATKPRNELIRVWSAACASGEEAYTAAMVLADLIGVDEFRSRVKIYATDVDEEALAVARHGEYPEDAFSDLPEERVNRYFEPSSGGRVFRGDLRRAVIFGRQDLIQDAPISRLDLLICRNALMYFNAEVQRRILSRFHFALRNSGVLFLGRAEMLLTSGALFTPTNVRHRVFRKVPLPELRDPLVASAEVGDAESASILARDAKVRELAFDSTAVANIVVSQTGRLILANEAARRMLTLSFRDLGRSFHDLELSYRPVELRAPMSEAQENRHRITLPPVERQLRSGERQYLDISLTPLYDEHDEYFGTSISFEDVTRYRSLQDDLERSNQELETASEELQSTNEELETANEELQSTVEELETTNEELQSANEELETMNEELESTNEELQAINDELRRRSEDYDRVNTYLGSILGSVRLGVVVVDRNGIVRTWNRRSEDLWGLRSDETEGQKLASLDIGLPVAELEGVLRGCLDGSSEHGEMRTSAVNRRGRKIDCRVTCTPLVDGAEQRGAVLVVEDEPAGG